MSDRSFVDGSMLLEREAELRAFDTCIAGLRAQDHDGGRCLLVHGEAGAGKTALVQAARLHGGAGVDWLWGACEPLIAAPALGPLIDLLDHLPPSLSQAMRTGRTTPDVLTGMLSVLRNRARPVVLVIDDCQWADSATLDLLRFVGRRIHLTRSVLVLCWRDDALAADHPLRGLLGSLPAPRTVRLALSPLGPQAVDELARRAGHSPDGLHAATGGNPFFVTEWLAGEGRGLPAAVRDAVLSRAAPLSAAAREALALVSVAPAGLEADVVDAIIDEAPAALDECVAAGLLQRHPSVLRFRHELARQSVLTACEAARVASLHGAVFDALSQRRASTGRLVHHAEHAGLARAVAELAPIAAAEAARAGAHRQAAQHCALALSHAAELDEPRRAGLCVAHAQACLALHRLDEARVSRRQALALHRRLLDPLAEGIDLRELARIEWLRGAVADGQVLAAAAIDVLSRWSIPRELAMAQATMAHLHMFDADPAETLGWGRQALAWFELHGDDEGRSYALSVVSAAELMRKDDPRLWQQLEDSLDIALRLDLPEPAARIHAALASAALVHRRHERLHAYCRAGLAYCEDRDLDQSVVRIRIRVATGLIEQGRWPAAQALLRQLRAIEGLSQREEQQSLYLLSLLDLRQGVDAAAPYWSDMIDGRRALDVDPWFAPQATVRVEAAWLRGDDAAAVAIAEAALPAARATGERWRLGQLVVWLRRCGQACSVAADGMPPPVGLEQAGDHRAAAAAWAALGCPYEQALALVGGDTDAVREALALLDALGAAPAARRARQRLRAMGARHVPRGPYGAVRNDPHGLSAREREVLGLVRKGLSNRDIALALHRSERTVEHHVSALLSKHGVASRVELSGADAEKQVPRGR